MMAENSQNTGREKQKKTSVKLDWIFGIRNNILPNLYMIDADTIVYPASHYIVIYNHTKKLPYSQLQQFIPGTPHSKGFVAFNVLNMLKLHKRYVATVEEIAAGFCVSIYSLTNSQGVYNLPSRLVQVGLSDVSITKVYQIAFSNAEQHKNIYLGLIGVNEEAVLILWKFDLDGLKDRVVYFPKLPSLSFKFLHISFSIFRNDLLFLISDKFFLCYTIKPFDVKYSFILENNNKKYGSSIFSHCSFLDGNFSICTNSHIIIFDTNFNIVQTINTVIETNNSATYITSILPLLDGFVAAGTNRRFEVYEKQTDMYEMIAEKKIYEFLQNLNEKQEKNNNSDKVVASSDKDRVFDFLTLASADNSSGNDKYLVATTSFNDLIQINLNVKDLDNQLVKHLISPFHSESIEGMDVCINKPYIITCSVDKSLRLWDYMRRNLNMTKNFDEEMYSVAYHPNGMHAIVSFSDKILPLHIYYDEIGNMTQNSITLKSNFKTKDIKFSNGGQFFAFDSGSRVEIWDFLNMVPHYVHGSERKREFGSNKVSKKTNINPINLF